MALGEIMFGSYQYMRGREGKTIAWAVLIGGGDSLQYSTINRHGAAMAAQENGMGWCGTNRKRRNGREGRRGNEWDMVELRDSYRVQLISTERGGERTVESTEGRGSADRKILVDGVCSDSAAATGGISSEVA